MNRQAAKLTKRLKSYRKELSYLQIHVMLCMHGFDGPMTTKEIAHQTGICAASLRNLRGGLPVLVDKGLIVRFERCGANAGHKFYLSSLTDLGKQLVGSIVPSDRGVEV